MGAGWAAAQDYHLQTEQQVCSTEASRPVLGLWVFLRKEPNTQNSKGPCVVMPGATAPR